MDIEKKIKFEQWKVLQKLKEESYRIVSGELVKYWIDFSFFAPGFTAENEEKALKKLEELGAIKITASGWEYE